MIILGLVLGVPHVHGADHKLYVYAAAILVGTVVGHTHLCVSDVGTTVAFYRDVLGFELMAQLGPMAAFLAAGGYHHHVGANTWESRGAPYAPAGTARLLRATIILPDAHELARVAARLDAEPADGRLELVDPSGVPLLLETVQQQP